MKTARHIVVCLGCMSIALLVTIRAESRPPIRKAFFNVYTTAEGTQLDDLPSNAGHCGVCHYDFDGNGPRNLYGLAVEVAINSGSFASTEDAISSLGSVDSDGDGYINSIELADLVNFSNTPTFPGIVDADTTLIVAVDYADILPFLKPSGGSDVTPPVVTVTSPNGGEVYAANSVQSVTWTATDASGISHINIYMSDDGGTTFRPIAVSEPDGQPFSWFVPNRPGATIIRVEARDGAGNFGADWSDGPLTITAAPAGIVPTTLRDIDLPGTQPFTTSEVSDPDVTCLTCHGDYDDSVEPHYNWKGSMMAHAQRDPLFLACLAIAEQDAPSVGDLCLRCHTPGGWLGGRSVDTDGGLVTAVDRQSVQCDFCHRLVDPNYVMGVSPDADQAVLDSTAAIPVGYGNGQYVVDTVPFRRGPFADAEASHAFLESPFHRSSNLCGTCHDVSNPVFNADGPPGSYSPNAFDTPHPDGDGHNMFPIERTFSEWSNSQYATTGVFAPQFAGDLPSGIVSTCQDCHMRDVTGRGCNDNGVPMRSDLPLHDLTGGNYFIPDILPAMFPGEVDSLRLAEGKARAIAMLQLAATTAVEVQQVGNRPKLVVTVTNETGHKLPSGYPEGRRIWLNVKGYDGGMGLVYESGAYNTASAVLTHDEDVKIYEIKPGISTRLSPGPSLPAGPSFHFVINDTVYSDNRIPPRGFTNVAFETIQSPPVAYTYADSQYWDETEYLLPATASFVEVTLYYQATSKEYIEFLKNENVTNTMGDELYNAWVAQGKAAPVAMTVDTMTIDLDPSAVGDKSLAVNALWQNYPNPFNPATTIRYSLAARQSVNVTVYDVAGRRVVTLVDGERPAGVQQVTWNGRNSNDESVASGVYFIRMSTIGNTFVRRAVLLK